MNATDLHRWCKARRGRMVNLADSLNVSKQMIHQWCTAERSISDERRPQIMSAIRLVEKAERRQ